jgi:winged helix DNA-binding protein
MPLRVLSQGLILRARLTAQMLATPARSPVDVAHRLLAIQAQDLRGARLAIRARTRGLSAADVHRALTVDRSLVISWLNRGTLHLVRAEDYPWLHALTAPRTVTSVMRRLGQERVSPSAAERGVGLIERVLADEGPLTRDQLRDRLASARLRTEGQALVHILALASLRGVMVRGPMSGDRHAFALVRDWLGTQPPFERDAALAELARRYLAGHGPGDARDLAMWAGLPLRDARAGLAAIGSEIVERADGLVEPKRHPAVEPLPPPRLLGPYDPVLHGWRSRDFVLGPHRDAVTVAGLFRPFAMVRGRAVGTWSLSQGAVRLTPFAPLSPAVARALAADAEDVQRFLGT